MSRTKSEHNGYQDDSIVEIKRHVEVMNSELGQCKIDLAVIKSLVERHDKLLWVVVAGIVGIILKLFIG
jgi:hypothetical protein